MTDDGDRTPEELEPMVHRLRADRARLDEARLDPIRRRVFGSARSSARGMPRARLVVALATVGLMAAGTGGVVAAGGGGGGTSSHVNAAVAQYPQPPAPPTPPPNVTVVTVPVGGVQSSQQVAVACISARAFEIHIRQYRAQRLVSAKVYVDGKLIANLKGANKLHTFVDLTKFSRVTVNLKIVARSNKGKLVTGKRIYHPCIQKKFHHIPKL